MAGLVHEGQEVITEGKEKEEAPADLALIAAAQKWNSTKSLHMGRLGPSLSKWTPTILSSF
jgi:hypothetical protein